MKLKVSVLSVMLALSSPVMAAEEAQTAANAQSNMEAASSAPAGVSPAKASLKEAKAALLSKKIEMLRKSVKESTPAKSGFSLFSSASKPIDAELLAEAHQLFDRYSAQAEADEVLHLQASLHMRMNNFPAAALDWMLLKVMYPQSTFVAVANKQLKALSDDDLKKQATVIDKLNKKITTLSGETDQRVGMFLEFLGTFREESFAPAIASASSNFLLRNENYANEDVIESAIAHQSVMIDNDVALYRFNKLLALYPDSYLRANSYYSIASIQRDKQKNYDAAAKSFATLIDNHPDSNETKLGYEALAAMYNEDMKQYPNAIKTYEAIIAKYKDDPIVLRALLAQAKVYESRMDNPSKAIDSYLKLADIFDKGQDGLNALKEAEKIAEKSIKNWSQAIAINDRIIARVPNSDDSAISLFSNANLTESKLGDKEGAKALYQQLVKDYSAHKLSKDAQKRIDAIEKEAAKK